jgi:hypothetical protein
MAVVIERMAEALRLKYGAGSLAPPSEQAKLRRL